MAMGAFQPKRHSAPYRANRDYHDWSTDGCSGVPDTGFTFDFTHPCHRHDFGYRNFKRLEKQFAEDTWNAVSKLLTDQMFRTDMREHCLGRPILARPTCYTTAQVYYWGVRALG